MARNNSFHHPEKWFSLIRRGNHPLLTVEPIIIGQWIYLRQHLKIDFRFHHLLRIDGNSMFLRAEWDEFKRQLAKKQKRDGSYLIKAAYDYYNIMDEAYAKAREISAKDITKANTQDLQQGFKDFFRLYTRLWTYCYLPWAAEEVLSSMLRKELKNKGVAEHSMNECLALLATSHKDSFTFREKADFLRLASRKFKSKETLYALIDEHLSKYDWLPFYFFAGTHTTRGDTLKRIKECANPEQELKRILEEQAKNLHESNKLQNKLRPEKRMLELIRTCREYSYLRTYRTEHLAMVHGMLKPFLAELAARYSLSYDELQYLTMHEAYTGLFSRDEMKKRKDDYVMTFENGDLRFHTEHTALLIKERFRNIKIIAGDSLHGKPASKGTAKGRARVIKSHYDKAGITAFEKGEILISAMTTPDFSSAIEKAAAIVTDEGGQLSHAAVISRELAKPCVVGTRNATKVFKDGDMVEVDADKGVVRKI